MIRRFKWVLSALLACMCVIMLGGCSVPGITKEKGLFDQIQDSLKDLKTYEAKAIVRYISNNGSNAYTTLQQCKNTGEYRVEVLEPEAVAGNVTIFDGKIICQYNKNINGKIAVGTTESAERSEIFLTTFIYNYFNQKEVAITVSSMKNDDSLTVLEATVPGQHPYLVTEKLFIDNETLKPMELVIYDDSGNERIVVTYKGIEYNVELDEKLFKTEQ